MTMIASNLLRRLPLLLCAAFAFLAVGVCATDEAGTAYLEEKSKEADVVTLPSGLRYKVLEKGKGAFHPMVDSPCLCHYAGTLSLMALSLIHRTLVDLLQRSPPIKSSRGKHYYVDID